MTNPLYILCQRPGCEQYVAVTKVSRQQTRKYCSQRCANLVNRNGTRNLAACRRGGLERARRARLRVAEMLKGKTLLEAFRIGYDRGLHSKHRQLRRRDSAA